jgi:hypothetical protein
MSGHVHIGGGEAELEMTKKVMFAFGGFRRGGSSIGFMVLQHLLLESGLSCFDFAKEQWDRGIKPSQISARRLLPALRKHDVVGCFRAVPAMSTKSLAKVRLFLLVRDPRDCQLSWYHARHLHQQDAVPQVIIDKASLHEDLIEEESFDSDIVSLLDWCELSGGRIFRYEDLITNPLRFIIEFAEFTKLPLTRSAIDLALVKSTFLQPQPDVKNHNRSGLPYAALRSLSTAQLQRLNKRFSPMLARLGYPLDSTELINIDVAALAQRDAMKRFVHGLAEENGYRIREIQDLRETVARIRTELDQLKQSSRTPD